VTDYPVLAEVVLDTTDPRRLAEFYREFLGYHYRAGDEPPPAGTDDKLGRDWLVLRNQAGARALAFQHVDRDRPTTWPGDEVPQQYHLDIRVPDKAALDRQHERALALGATVRLDQSDNDEEPLRTYADPGGHLFCVFVGFP
jgi:catechol 2,3-dioxygenase-like lactoylglutathione lyase family enzyme